MNTLVNDIKYAFRMLWKRPGFTAIALITLAIGIGANTIMFSIADLLLLAHPGKVKAPEQLVYCGFRDPEALGFRYSEYLTVRDSGLVFSELLAQHELPDHQGTLVHGGSVQQVEASYVSANYFSVLGVTPIRGRGFVPEEEQGGDRVVVLSWPCWQRLGSDSELVGQFVMVDGVRCEVVGIMPKGFTGVTFDGPDLWLPLGSYRSVSKWARQWPKVPKSVGLVGRLKPDLTLPVAQAQLESLFADFKPEGLEHDSRPPFFELRKPGRFWVWCEDEEDYLRKPLFNVILLATSAIILVIACLNLANMLIVQGAARQQEITVRLALGGGRWRIIRQLFTESLLLALLGGVLGMLLAFGSINILNTWIITTPDYFAKDLRVGLNSRVLAVTLGLCLITTLLFGLRPALWLSKRDLAGEMKVCAGHVLGPLRRKRDALAVMGQIALAVTLVLCAVLLTRSALKIAQPDMRFPLDDKLSVVIDPLSAGYDPARGVQVCEALTDHLESLPEVKALGASTRLFYGGGGPISISESFQSGSWRPFTRKATLVTVSRDYFTALEIPLLQGRFFIPMDRVPNAEKVVIIDESLARQLRSDGNALGCSIRWGFFSEHSEPYRVVGIVPNVPGIGDREVYPQIYTPAGSEELSPCLYVHVANRGAMDALRRRIVEEIRRIDARVPVLPVVTLAQRRDGDATVWRSRFYARLGLVAGAAALFLSALGIYAIKGYMVALRTSEIGIRMALGATKGRIIGIVLREGGVVTVTGLLIGLGLGLGVAKVASHFLYGINPLDPISIVVTMALLGSASLLASCIPVRRATKIDPMEALRYE
jgi:putative ABC transport system permease protein